MVLRGRLAFDAAPVPPGGHGAVPPDEATEGEPHAPGMAVPRPIPARLEGEALTARAFTRTFTGALLLRPTCVGSWCGGRAFDRRDLATTQVLAACLADGACGG